MSRTAYCANCPSIELITDQEQEVGYCEACIDNEDTRICEERRHPDE